MKSHLTGLGFLLVTLPAHSQNIPEAKLQNLPEGIETAISNYVHGAQLGDQNRLRAAYETNKGIMFSVRRSPEGEILATTSFDDFVSFFTDPNPVQTSGKILSFDIVEDHMAFVKLEYIEGTDYYIDYLTLLNVNDNWQIVSKTFWRKAQ